MTTAAKGYASILVAIDFSPHSSAALQQALWLGKKYDAKLVLAHALRDLRKAVHATSYEAKLDLLYGEGELFQHNVRSHADAKLKQLIAEADASGLDVTYETLLGEPYVELIHAVQSEKYDLVVAGTHGASAWEDLLIGSTAKRLIRKCPCSVWIVTAEHAEPPKVILAGTDFSEVSLKAAREASCVAQHANAAFHLLHVIDSLGIPKDVLVATERTSRLRQEISDEARCRLDDFLERSACDVERTHIHIGWGTPWKEIRSLAVRMKADLVATGTVGRGGIKGLLLGSTAENVLSASHCSVLTVKPDDFVSPIEPAFWELHPATPT